jgi:hypothetical protein
MHPHSLREFMINVYYVCAQAVELSLRASVKSRTCSTVSSFMPSPPFVLALSSGLPKVASVALALAAALEPEMYHGIIAAILAEPGDYSWTAAVLAEWRPNA